MSYGLRSCSMRPDDVTRLRHMVAAAEDAVSFVSSRSREDLLNDRMLALAVARRLAVHVPFDPNAFSTRNRLHGVPVCVVNCTRIIRP